MSYARLQLGLMALLGVLLHGAALIAHAASSDRDKPATIEADEVEFDFRTGKRTYKGNVIVVQGSLRITGDKMVVQYEQDSEQIENATTWGEPATFKQRPEGKEHDVYGEGETIILNEIENTLTLIEKASLTQAGNTAKGKEIVYDMTSDKMTVKGMARQQTGDETVSTDEETGRARVIITPEEQAGSDNGAGGEAGSGNSSEDESGSQKSSE